MKIIDTVAGPIGRGSEGVRVARSVTASRVTVHARSVPFTVIEALVISSSTALRTMAATGVVTSTSISTSPAKTASSSLGSRIRR